MRDSQLGLKINLSKGGRHGILSMETGGRKQSLVVSLVGRRGWVSAPVPNLPRETSPQKATELTR